MKERRKYPRYQATPGAYVVFGPDANPCQIVDVSKSGLSLLYVDKGDVLGHSYELSLLLEEAELKVEKIPFQIITNFNIARDMALGGGHPLVRVGLKFGELTPAQRTQLNHFLWFATSREM